MKIKDRGKKKFVKIIIGFTEIGMTNLLPKTKSISIDDTTPEEVYEIIFDAIKRKEEDNEQTSTRK